MINPQVTIIDYGMGNLLSVQRALEFCGAKVIVTSDPKIILSSERLILPGVGAFANAMLALEKMNLIDVICKIASRKIPLLGICLGMQLLFDESEEFELTSGLGLIPGKVVAIPINSSGKKRIKVPHIGWSDIQPSINKNSWGNSILEDIHPGDSAYFVHSFMVLPEDNSNCIADCFYGNNRIASVIIRDNIMGCQFHPEKSGEIGLKILKSFLNQ